MFDSILNKFGTNVESFLDELFKKDLNTQALNKMLSSKKFSISYQDNDGNTFLHHCITHNKFKSAKWLITNGIDLGLKNKKEVEAIELAVNKDNHLIVKLILETKKININQVDNDGRSLLQNSVLAGANNITKELLKHEIDVNNVDYQNRNVLFDAISYGDNEVIAEMMNQEDIDLNLQDLDGETILHKRETRENEELTIALIQKGADPTICDNEGKNLLYHTAIQGNPKGTKILDAAIKSGSNINAKIRHSNNILMETLSVFYKLPDEEKQRRKSLLEMAENLVVKGIDINAVNDKGENSLFDAIRNNDYNACAFLLSNDIDMNEKNNDGDTAFFTAVYQGMQTLDIILLLLEFGADPRIKNQDNKDLLEVLNELILHTHHYKISTDYELVKKVHDEAKYIMVLREILENCKFNLDNLTSLNKPLFFMPLLEGDYDLFALYITDGFDVNTKDENGFNIFDSYIYKVFQLNKNFDNFKKVLFGLNTLSVKTNNLHQDGQTIFFSIIQEQTIPELFETLSNIIKINYSFVDNKGRTIMHSAILNKNIKIAKVLYEKDNNAINISDNFGILPVTYAALTADAKMVKMLLEYKNLEIKSGRQIPLTVRKKFSPILEKVDSIKNDVNDKDLIRKLNIVIQQVKSDFSIL